MVFDMQRTSAMIFGMMFIMKITYLKGKHQFIRSLEQWIYVYCFHCFYLRTQYQKYNRATQKCVESDRSSCDQQADCCKET